MGYHLQEDTEEPTEPAPDPYQDQKVREALEMVRLRQNDPGAQSILDPMFRDRRSCTPAGIGRTGHCNVSVYDTGVTIVAEADNPRLIGVTMWGKTDITGVPFRDRILHQALEERRSGWVDYVWMTPEYNGICHKSAYFRLAEGTDGGRQIVVGGGLRIEASGPVIQDHTSRGGTGDRTRDGHPPVPVSMCGF
jgi:hypothetical protein